MATNEGIFKAYDIRGIYPSELNEQTAYDLGRALVEFFNPKKVVVGKDIRKSSDVLEEKLIEGLTEGGADVIKIGVSTTPMLYYASGNLDVDLGVVITASHNPAEYNGFKICKKEAIPVGEGSGMEELKDLVMRGVFKDVAKKGTVFQNINLKELYLNYIESFLNKESFSIKKKVVFDFANAMGILDKEVLERFLDQIDPIYLYDEYDGRFPNHEANPLKTETLEELQKLVKKEGADLGVAYDGDADRVGFVDEKGGIVPMDFVTALIAGEILKKHPGGKVLMDLRSSNAVKEYIEKRGGIVERCRVGHSLIKAQMRKEEAIFAGELSGHYFFEENFKAEMSTLAFIMIINLINESGKTMSQLTQELNKYHHSGEINSEVKDKKVVFDKLKEFYMEGKLDELDGIRIDFEDWWFSVRASNTEPKIRLNLEAKDQAKMKEKTQEVLSIIRG